MISVPMSIAIIALLFALVALIVGCVSLSIIVGLKNSTHRIQMYDPSTNQLTNFGDKPSLAENEEEPEMINPNKKQRNKEVFKPFNTEIPKVEEPFVDLDNPEEVSNNW